MERLDRKNRGPNGTRPLIHYMNPEDKTPIALAVELFFSHNILVIKSVYPDIIEREDLREELKDHFESLLHRPVGNNLHSCFRKWRSVSPDCQFGYLIKVVKKVYETYVKNNFNLHTMKDWKQRDGESVRDYNLRYYQRLAELYPDFENTLYRMTGDETDQNNFWRMEIVGKYIASLRPELRNKMPVFKNNEKCLENAMVTAEAYEKELSEMEERIVLREQRERRYERRTYSVEARGNRDELECHNCGKKGHLKRECRKPLAECQHCKKKGHLIQFCYGKRARPGGNMNTETSKKLVALVITSALLLSTIVTAQNELGEYHYQSGITIVTDIFKVTNHRVSCEIIRYIPMLGDGRTFYPPKGSELITFTASESDYGTCMCTIKTTPAKGFTNAQTGDCYALTNTSVIFEEGIPKWEQFDMELHANKRETSGIYWLVWNEYVIRQRKANYLPAKLTTDPYKSLDELIAKPLTPEEIKDYKDKHVDKYAQAKQKVGPGAGMPAIKVKEDMSEVMNDVDDAAKQLELQRDVQRPESNLLDRTIVADQQVGDPEELAESSDSSLNSEKLDVFETSLGITPRKKGSPKTISSIFPSMKAVAERVPNIRKQRPQLTSEDSSESDTPGILTSASKKSKSEELTKSLSAIIEKSKENDISGIVKELMNSFRIVNGMESVGVLVVCLSVILGAYYKRRIVNQMINSIWKALIGERRRTATPRRDVHISRPILNARQEDEESIELTTTRTREVATNTERNSKDKDKKRPLELCGTDILQFTEKEKKLEEAARKAGYILMLQSFSNNRAKHTPTIIMNIANKWVQTYIDDGSDISLISEQRWRSLGQPTIKKNSTWIGNTNEQIVTKGTTYLRIRMGRRRVMEEFYVVKGLTMDFLIGRTFLSRFSKYMHHYGQETITIGNYVFPKSWNDYRKKLVLMTTRNTTLLPGMGQDFH
uniref:CCHC-type domain-containing protein n=1 Tax=Strongyloides papillosus TaxID=174720 RepID=A0A0N5C478_STREA